MKQQCGMIIFNTQDWKKELTLHHVKEGLHFIVNAMSQLPVIWPGECFSNFYADQEQFGVWSAPANLNLDKISCNLNTKQIQYHVWSDLSGEDWGDAHPSNCLRPPCTQHWGTS